MSCVIAARPTSGSASYCCDDRENPPILLRHPRRGRAGVWGSVPRIRNPCPCDKRLTTRFLLDTDFGRKSWTRPMKRPKLIVYGTLRKMIYFLGNVAAVATTGGFDEVPHRRPQRPGGERHTHSGAQRPTSKVTRKPSHTTPSDLTGTREGLHNQPHGPGRTSSATCAPGTDRSQANHQCPGAASAVGSPRGT